LQAALSYYEDFLKQQDHNQLAREELLREHSRVATILDAIGRQKDAQRVWNQVFHIALTGGDGQAAVHLVPANSKLRLLRLPSVQEELMLSPQQARAVLDLKAKGRAGQGDPKGPPVEKQALALLKPQQIVRLNQLQVQQARLWAFQDPAVNAALALTPAQRQAILAIQKEAQATSGDRGKSLAMERILKLFTGQQMSRWRQLVGEPFPGALPPGDLILCLGRFNINIAPVGVSRDHKKDIRPAGTP
jgi:hypothetical protein